MDEHATIVDLERWLRDSETRYRLMIESWAQAVWETDPNGFVVADSPSWRAYTGQTPEEWLGYGWLDAIHPDDRTYAERQWREAIAAREPVDAEFRLRAPTGGWRWTNVRAAPVLDADGNIEKWAGMNIDIHARKTAEAALRESEEKHRTLFDTMGQGCVEVEVVRNADGRAVDYRYLELNPAFERLFGIPVAEAKGRTGSEVFPGLQSIWHEAFDQIVRRSKPERLEYLEASLDRWFVAFAYPQGGDRLIILSEDVTEHKRAEVALRENEERQAFLLKLSDALRPLADPEEVQATAAELLGRHLGVDNSNYYEIDAEGWAVRSHGYTTGAVGVPVRFKVTDFGQQWADSYQAGRTVVISDMATDERFSTSEREAWRANRLCAGLGVPLLKKGRLCATFGFNHAQPRHWTSSEIALAEETAERTWAAVERARAETALRESEERFTQFANASSGGIWVRNAATLGMEYVSPAIGPIYGVELDTIGGDIEKWAALIVPDDRNIALQHIERARLGEAVVYEFRIQRLSDQAFRWIRDTGFPLGGNGHVRRIGGIAEDVTEAKLAVEHQAVLLAELQHRVRNIMAVIRVITARTGERADSVQSYTDLMMGRLLALARVQALLTRAANVSVSIAGIVQDEVSSQAQHEGQYVLDGPDIALSPKAAEVLTLAIHELATNALKYGALSVSHGRITVKWATFEKRGTPWLAFDWTEEGAPAGAQPTADAPRRRGFGSELIEGRVPYELKGRGWVTIEPGGARCHMEFPLRESASILETDAPQQATVFGGALDMTGEADLSGHRILVVEDDYFLATDAVRALQGAGAEVLGPFSTEEDAKAELDEQRPDAAVVDINLGLGPSFKLATTLKDTGIPFVFTTGYDLEVIPAEFEGVERLQKPVQLRQIIAAIARLLTPTE